MVEGGGLREEHVDQGWVAGGLHRKERASLFSGMFKKMQTWHVRKDKMLRVKKNLVTGAPGRSRALSRRRMTTYFHEPLENGSHLTCVDRGVQEYWMSRETTSRTCSRIAEKKKTA